MKRRHKFKPPADNSEEIAIEALKAHMQNICIGNEHVMAVMFYGNGDIGYPKSRHLGKTCKRSAKRRFRSIKKHYLGG